MVDLERVSSERDSDHASCSGSSEPIFVAHPLARMDGSRDLDGDAPSDVESEDYQSGDDEPFSEIGEPDSVEVVFVREGVAMWPTRKCRIMGRLVLVKQQHVLFFSWLPYSQGTLNSDGSFDAPSPSFASSPELHDRTMYAVHSIPVSEIKSFKKHAPSIGWQYIVVVLNTGVSIPPLYFTTGGVKAFFSVLKQHVCLAKSLTDATAYLVNDVADPLQRSLTSLHLADVLLGGPPSASSSTFPPPHGPVAASWAAPGEWAGSSSAGPLVSQMLEQVQRLSLLARDATSSLFTAAPFPGPAFSEEGQLIPDCEAAAVRESSPAGSGMGSLETKAGQASTLVGVFELVEKEGLQGLCSPFQQRPGPPLSQPEWNTFFSDDGRCLDEKALRKRIFHSGLEQSVRREAWMFLLGVFAWSSTRQERQQERRRLQKFYHTIKQQWTSITPAQAAKDSKWRERRSRVEKDVWRTDRAHPFFSGDGNRNVKRLYHILLTYCKWNSDVGYCQGMSDLLAPLLYVMRDETDAFWCFCHLMETRNLAANFHQDSTALHAQLGALRRLVQLLDPPLHAQFTRHNCLNYFFCYRWLLVHFKREFTFDEVLRLWEILWSQHLTPHFHIYMCAAVLGMHRRAILESNLDFDGMLRFCIQLSGKLDLMHTLRYATSLFQYAGRAGTHALEDALTAGGPVDFA